MNDPNYLDYIIYKLNTETPFITNYRKNVKAYVFYKAAQERIKAHELNLIRKTVTNKKKRSKKTVEYSIINPEKYEMIYRLKERYR